ncbi:hypothetical protein LSCM1_01268 [Leishmania martiniquensis]|uniref:Uncharacterized protein n=1 Tax=Leishmania martiniquensis TaxID=1580590 RepID=A0A836GGD4_9TRYP|nr:hypothetical protein LSCM1_01268 [Leishmania martiniquensis]
MSFFERPHRLMSASSVVMGLKPETLREIDDYAVWMEKVRAELVAIYGEGAMESEVSHITYATSDDPTHFSSRITGEVFERLRGYKALLGKADSIKRQRADKMQLQEVMEAAIRLDTHGGKSLRQQQRDLRRLKESIAQLNRQEAEAKYQLACLSPQLKNIFMADAIRVCFL